MNSENTDFLLVNVWKISALLLSNDCFTSVAYDFLGPIFSPYLYVFLLLFYVGKV